MKSDRFLVDDNGFIGYRHSYCKRDNYSQISYTIFTARQTRTSLYEHDVIKVRIKYLATQIELVLPTFKSCTVHEIIEHLTLGQLSSL